MADSVAVLRGLKNKALSDPIFRNVVETYQSDRSLREAGFFDDNLPKNILQYDISGWDWLVTPVYKINANIRLLKNGDERPLLVLLACDAFAPIKGEHLKMMQLSKEILEHQGYAVVGGYLSCSHDTWQATEDEDTTLPAQVRLDLCDRATAASPWLSVDPWEAVYAPAPINFSQTLARLDRYLNANVPSPRPITVGLSFGSEKAGRMRAFVHNGIAVCMDRGGWEGAALARFLSETRIKEAYEAKRIFITDGVQENEKAQRVEGPVNSLPLVEAAYAVWKSNNKNNKKIQYIIHDDLERMSKDITQNRIGEESAFEGFRRDLKKTIENAYKDNLVEVTFIDDAKRNETIVLKKEGNKTISLDPGVEGDYSLQSGELYAISNGQRRPLRITNDPESENIKSQIAAIKPGTYNLIKDERMSETTLKKIRAFFPKDIHILQEISPKTIYDKNETVRVALSDFLVGGKGGLIVELPDGYETRVPYMLPYVSIRNRAGIPTESEKESSLALWKANQRFFGSLSPEVTIFETSENFKKLAKSIDLKETELMTDVCRWHVERLETTE